MAEKKKPDFEAGLEALEQLVTRLESNALTLEEAMKTYEEGKKLCDSLNAQLNASEKKLKVLGEEENREE